MASRTASGSLVFFFCFLFRCRQVDGWMDRVRSGCGYSALLLGSFFFGVDGVMGWTCGVWSIDRSAVLVGLVGLVLVSDHSVGVGRRHSSSSPPKRRSC
ncbi:uncharacterized protein BKA78DRAFT_310393 [Phyllosticta capitalensis]|uniref:uncharacterized protein n=1 Tax=Phyllosticta capitalensis TaxID=121624 RepID=UPI003131BDB7